jgi:hypothetical protein
MVKVTSIVQSRRDRLNCPRQTSLEGNPPERVDNSSGGEWYFRFGDRSVGSSESQSSVAMFVVLATSRDVNKAFGDVRRRLIMAGRQTRGCQHGRGVFMGSQIKKQTLMKVHSQIIPSPSLIPR